MVNVINALPGIILSFVIIIFFLGMGATMVTDLESQQCKDAGGIWGTFYENETTDDASNAQPYNLRTGCCGQRYNGSQCDNESFLETTTLNTSESGLGGIATMADWTPTLALAIIIGIVVSVLVGFLGFAVTGSRT